jgi:hypothetical protein
MRGRGGGGVGGGTEKEEGGLINYTHDRGQLFLPTVWVRAKRGSGASRNPHKVLPSWRLHISIQGDIPEKAACV